MDKDNSNNSILSVKETY